MTDAVPGPAVPEPTATPGPPENPGPGLAGFDTDRSDTDRFDTAAIRATAILAWTTSPTRFREDANLEEDHARGYYRDRVVVELAQNAADAAALAGVPGRLLLRLGTTPDGGAVLTVANTGRPLDRAGVLALASMRASGKQERGVDDEHARPVGRFGVGFAAVRAVSDDITIAGAHGGVRFCATTVRALLADTRAGHDAVGDVEPPIPVSTTIAGALDRPASALPILRLPFPADEAIAVPDGYDTVVVARLRGPREHELVDRLLAEVDDTLLLALPALASVRIEVAGQPARVLADVGDRWVTRRIEGRHDPADLADRPFEERARSGWSVTWAVPRAAGPPSGAVRHVLHAPTPTDEPCSLPAVLVATFPLDPSRRHVAPGAATEALLRHAGAGYADLVEILAGLGRDPLAFVPVGLGLGRLDAELRAHAVAALRRRRILTPVGVGGPDEPVEERLTPREATAVLGAPGHDRRALQALAPMLPGLVALPPGPDALTRLRALGVEPIDLADAVEALPTGHDPATWRGVYEALAPHVAEPGVADALAALPVPLADGRTVRGPRGLVLLDPSAAADGDLLGVAAAGLAPWGLRVVHEDATHPLLGRLGAVPATGRTLLAHPAVRSAVRSAAMADAWPDEPAADAVLTLVAAALDDGAPPEGVLAEHPWLASLPLPDEDGTPRPAAELVLPDSWAAGVLAGLAPVGVEIAERHGPAPLAAVGVRAGLVVVRVPDVVAEPSLATDADDGPESALEGWADYLDDLAARFPTGTYLGELTAVADLDVVADDAWPDVLARLATDPDLRAALLEPVRAAGLEAPSYTAWWLRDLLAAPFAAPGADVPFLEPPPPEVAGAPGLDAAVLAALGAVGDLSGLDHPAWERYLDCLPPVGSEVPLAAALSLWRGLADAVRPPDPGPTADPLAPDRVPVLRLQDATDVRVVVVPAADAVVSAEPMWTQLADVVPAPPESAAALARLLGVALASGDGGIGDDDAQEEDTPAGVRTLLPGVPATWWEHDDLRVDGVPVTWWVRPVPGSAAVEVHAATTAGLARAFAQAAGRWELCAAVEVVLADPARAHELAAESAWTGSTVRPRLFPMS